MDVEVPVAQHAADVAGRQPRRRCCVLTKAYDLAEAAASAAHALAAGRRRRPAAERAGHRRAGRPTSSATRASWSGSRRSAPRCRGPAGSASPRRRRPASRSPTSGAWVGRRRRTEPTASRSRSPRPASRPRCAADVAELIWGKLALAAMSPLSSVLRRDRGAGLGAAPEGRALVERMFDEVVAVAGAEGVALDRDGGVGARAPQTSPAPASTTPRCAPTCGTAGAPSWPAWAVPCRRLAGAARRARAGARGDLRPPRAGRGALMSARARCARRGFRRPRTRHGVHLACGGTLMRAAVTTGPGVITVESVADPDPGPGDAVVDVGAVGCAAPTCTCSSASGTTPASRCARATRSAGRSRLPPATRGPLGWGRPSRSTRPCRAAAAGPACAALGRRARLPRARGGAAGRAGRTGRRARRAAARRRRADRDRGRAGRAVLHRGQWPSRRAELRGDELLLVVGAGPIGLAITVPPWRAGQAVLVDRPAAGPAGARARARRRHALDPTARTPWARSSEWTGGAGADVVFEASGSGPGWTPRSLAAWCKGGRLVVVGVAAHDARRARPAGAVRRRHDRRRPGRAASRRRCAPWSAAQRRRRPLRQPHLPAGRRRSGVHGTRSIARRTP